MAVALALAVVEQAHLDSAAVAVLVAIFGVPGIGVLGYRSPGILEFWDIVVLDTGFLGILLDGNR